MFINALSNDSNPAAVVEAKPVVLVSTEQPTWGKHDRALLHAVHSIWCMDVVDLQFLHESCDVPLHKLHIVPVMFGTYVGQKARTGNGCSKTVHALQFGWPHDRRKAVMQQLEDELPGKTIVNGTMFGTELEDKLATTHVVVAIHLYPEPRVFGIHRMMQVLQYPDVRIVAEESVHSVYTRLLLQPFGDRVVFANYEDLVSVTKQVIQEAESKSTTFRPEPAYVTRLYGWDGQTSWVDLITADVPPNAVPTYKKIGK